MLMTLAPSLLLYVSLLLDHLPAADALRVPISGHHSPRDQVGLEHVGRGLGRRAAMEGDLQDQSDVRYYTNVTLGGQLFSVLVDTGRCVIISVLSCVVSGGTTTYIRELGALGTEAFVGPAFHRIRVTTDTPMEYQ